MIFVIYDQLMKCMDAIFDEVKNTKNQSIINIQKELEKTTLTRKAKDDLIKSAIQFTLGMGIMQHISPESFEEIFVDVLKDVVSKIPDLQTKVKFKVSLANHKELWREIHIPLSFTLADLCYVILDSFKADGSHLFKIKYKNNDYYCLPYEGYANERYANDTSLSELKLTKNSKMELTYDFGENYIFVVEYLGKEKCESITDIEDIQIKDGNGYGIIDDFGFLLDVILDHPQDFHKILDDIGLSEEDFYYNFDDFDVSENTMYVIDNFEATKYAYENPNEMLPYDEEDDDIYFDDEEIFN